MFDSKHPIKAQRVVSMRELAQSAARLIAEVERDSSIFVRSRHGQMVAVIGPLPGRTVVEFVGKDPPPFVDEEVEMDPQWADLDEQHMAVLRTALQSHPMPFGVDGMPIPVNRLGAALGGLELSGLIERIGAGRRLTREGLAAARWLDSRDGAPS